MTATTYEEQQDELAAKVEMRIKTEMRMRNKMTQEQLGKAIGEGTYQTGRAIRGENSPKSKVIRQKIFKLFMITDF